jgi:hypothetical protein
MHGIINNGKRMDGLHELLNFIILHSLTNKQEESDQIMQLL